MFKVGQEVRCDKTKFRMKLARVEDAGKVNSRWKGGLLLFSPEGLMMRWKQGDSHIQILESSRVEIV